ncbi:MAG: RNA polymerase sigma factor [Lewinellaceae bacterium]|nr:RNA polymerase sigma factor [Lewinellaceae bacterium]
MRAFETAEVRRFARCVAEWVYNFLLSYVQNEQDAEELVQDTLLGALDGVRQFRGESSLKTWVYRIAMNKVRDHIKSRSRLKRSMQIASLEGRRTWRFQASGNCVGK